MDKTAAKAIADLNIDGNCFGSGSPLLWMDTAKANETHTPKCIK